MAVQRGGYNGVVRGENEPGRVIHRFVDRDAAPVVFRQIKTLDAGTNVTAVCVFAFLIAGAKFQDGQMTQFQIALVQIQAGGAVGRLKRRAITSRPVERFFTAVRTAFIGAPRPTAMKTFVRMIGAVGPTVAESGDRNAPIRADTSVHVGRAETKPGRNVSDRPAHFQRFVGLVAAVVVAVAPPTVRNAVFRLDALKLGSAASGGRTFGRVVLVGPVVTIRLSIALPRDGDALDVAVSGFDGGAAEKRIRTFGGWIRRGRQRPGRVSVMNKNFVGQTFIIIIRVVLGSDRV